MTAALISAKPIVAGGLGPAFLAAAVAPFRSHTRVDPPMTGGGRAGAKAGQDYGNVSVRNKEQLSR